jgi:hypothetical protein
MPAPFSQAARLAICVALVAGCAAAPPPPPPKAIDFKAELSRYGEWIVVAPYGRVWHPNARVVGPDFIPYVTGGGWVRGAKGWVFEAKWPWAQYPFHYGRWFVADDLGWLWYPDQTWGEAWVQWRSGDGYVGWSPLPPEVSSAHTAPAAWSYVKMQHLSAHETEPFQLKPQEALKVHPRTEPLTERGPDLEQVRAVGGLNRDPPLPEAVVEPAPEPPPQVKAEEPPPPPVQPKSKKKKKKR